MVVTKSHSWLSYEIEGCLKKHLLTFESPSHRNRWHFICCSIFTELRDTVDQYGAFLTVVFSVECMG